VRALLLEVDSVVRFGHAADGDERQRHFGGVKDIKEHHVDASAVVEDGNGNLAAPGGIEGAVVSGSDGDGVDGVVLDEAFV
jgi:hypothetical protein